MGQVHSGGQRASIAAAESGWETERPMVFSREKAIASWDSLAWSKLAAASARTVILKGLRAPLVLRASERLPAMCSP